MERKFRVIESFTFTLYRFSSKGKDLIEEYENIGFKSDGEHQLIFKIGEIYTQEQIDKVYSIDWEREDSLTEYMFNFQEITPAEEILRKLVNEENTDEFTKVEIHDSGYLNILIKDYSGLVEEISEITLKTEEITYLKELKEKENGKKI